MPDRDGDHGWLRELLARFRADLPGMIVIWIGVGIAIVAYLVIRDEPAELPWLVPGWLILGIALTPLLWMRWEVPLVRRGEHRTRHAFVAIGAGCLWALLVLVALGSVLAALGLD